MCTSAAELDPCHHREHHHHHQFIINSASPRTAAADIRVVNDRQTAAALQALNRGFPRFSNIVAAEASLQRVVETQEEFVVSTMTGGRVSVCFSHNGDIHAPSDAAGRTQREGRWLQGCGWSVDVTRCTNVCG